MSWKRSLTNYIVMASVAIAMMSIVIWIVYITSPQ